MTSRFPRLATDERLGRSVFSQKSSRRARKTGQIDMKIFLEREEAESISVDRMDHAPLTLSFL